MSRVWDENWFGSTKTLDVHMGWLRRKLGDDAADPRFIHTVRGVGFRFTAPDEEQPVGLRARLLLALAYVLVLAIVALEVPLALSVRDRVDAEVRSQARAQADVRRRDRVGDLLGARDAARARARSSTRGRERPRPRDRRRRARPRCSPTPRARPPGRSYAGRPEIAAALRGRADQRDAPLRDARARTCSPPRSRSCRDGRDVGAVRVTQSVDAVDRAMRRTRRRARR